MHPWTDWVCCPGNPDDKLKTEYLRMDPSEACRADYGSPFMCIDNNRPYLYGITSLGVNCGVEGYPSVYVKLTSYIDWIRENTFYN